MIDSNYKEYEDVITEIKDIKDEALISMSRSSCGYVYATSKGQELSINVARTMNLLDSQPVATDEFFYDLKISIKDLAKKINVRYANLNREIKEGDFLDQLRTSAFVFKIINEKGEVEFADYLNAMSRVKYDNGILYFRKNPDMERFLLNLGSSTHTPFFEIFTRSANSLAKHKQIELYKLIENELSLNQYRNHGMKNKAQMLNDHKWHELHIHISKVRQSAFSIETYEENHTFVSVLLKRQLKTISQKTDIEIDFERIKTDRRGNEAEYVIVSARRKKGYTLSEIQSLDKNVRYFEDEELNSTFINYLELIACDEKRKKFFKKRLIECINANQKTTGEGINPKVAIQIIEYSIRHNYKDFYPLKDDEITKIVNDELDENTKKRRAKYKELEQYYLSED